MLQGSSTNAPVHASNDITQKQNSLFSVNNSTLNDS